MTVLMSMLASKCISRSFCRSRKSIFAAPILYNVRTFSAVDLKSFDGCSNDDKVNTSIIDRAAATQCALSNNSTDAALTKKLLFELINLRKRADNLDKKVNEHNRMKFLGDLNLWVRDTHLQKLVNLTIKHKLKVITGRGARKADTKMARLRQPHLLEYIPGVVDYLNAGKDTKAMWLANEDLRALAVRNYEIIAEVAKPYYDVALILQQSAATNEPFHIADPILHSKASTVESLGRFLSQSPSNIHMLHPEDHFEVQRKLQALQNMFDYMRAEET